MLYNNYITCDFWAYYALLPHSKYQQENISRRTEMGNFFRRILAFILGIVFCVTASVGGIVGGAYWAYKNLTLSKVGVNDPAMGDLVDQPIEDLVDLIINGAKDPSSYTFAELEKKYGVKLEDILSKFGLKVEIVTKDQELNFKALKEISIFTLFDSSGDGINLLLDSLSARALFNFFPDSFLSAGTRAQLSVYSVADLINKEETTGKLGLYSALNSAKVGGILPTVFEEKYNQATHTYEYEVKEDKNQALTLVKDMEVGAFIKTFIDGDSDILTELNAGGLSSIGDMQISEIFSTIAGAFSESLKETVEKYGQILAGKTVRDLFVLTENGKYSFAIENLFNDIKLGYIFGYKEVDGVWYDGDKVASGVLAVLSDVNLYNIVKGISESNVKDAIISELGIINLGDIFEQFLGYKQEDGQWVDANGKAMPKILQGLAGVSVAQIFDEDAPIIDNIINALDESFGDITAGDVLADFVGFKKVDEQWVDEKGNELNPILSGLLSMKIADLIRKDYTLESIVGIFKEAIGDVKAGEILGYTFDGAKQIWVDSNGNPVNAYINVLCDMECNNVLDIFLADDSPTNIVRTFLGDIKMGDLLVAVLKYSYDEVNGKWLTSEGNEAPSGVAKLAEIKLWQFVAAFDKNEPFNLYDMLDGLSLGDFIGVYDEETDTYTITADLIPSLKGKVLSGVLSTLLNIDIGHFLDAKTENDEYVQILKDITIGQVVQAITGYAQNTEGDWIAPEGKNTDRLLELLCSIRLSVNDVVELFKGNLTASQFVSKLLGELKLGDFIGSAFGLHYDTATNTFVDKNNEKTYDLYDFLMNINANNVIDFIETKDVFATIKEFISPLQIGDFFAPFMKLKEYDGVWTKENGTQRLIHILESVFNLYLTNIIETVESATKGNLDKLKLVEDLFGKENSVEYFLDFVKLPDNEVLAQIVDIVIYDLVNDLINESDKAEVLLKYFGEWTIGEALDGVLPARIANNQLTQNLFALSVHSIYTDIIKSSDVLTALEEKVFDKVSLSTIVAYALEDQSKLPTLVKDLLAVEINYIIDNVKTAVDTGNVYIGDIVKKVCGERTIKDYLQDFVKLPDNEVLNQVTAVVISDFVTDLAKDDKAEVILDYFGEWTIGQALKGLLPKAIEDNALTQNVFALSLYTIYTQIVKADDVLAAVEEKVFDGVTLSTLVAYAVSDQSKFPNIAKDLLALEVNYIIDTVKTAVKDQTVYFGNIINKICAGRTIADYVEDFVKLPDNKALNQIKSVVICDFYNDLISSSDKAQVILDYFGSWTLGEALGKDNAQQGEITTQNAYDVSVSGAATQALVGGTTVEAGNKFTENMYALSALSVYTDIIKADDVLAAIQEKVFEGVTISMIAAYAIANQSGLPNIVKDVFGIEVNYIIDTVKTAVDTGVVYVADIVKKVCGNRTIGDYLDFVKLPDNDAVNKITSVVIYNFVKELFDSSDKTDVVLNTFGTWTVGDAIDEVLPARLKENQFIKNVIGISAKTFYSDILKSSDVLNSVRTKILNEVKFSTLFDFVTADQSKLPKVAKDLLDVELNFVVDIIQIKDMTVSNIVKTICGDSTIGDYVNDFVKLPNNDAVNKISSVVISAFVEDVLNKSDKVQVILDYFGTWTIGEVLKGALPNNIEDNQLTKNLYDLSAVIIYTDIVKASDILAAVQDKVLNGVSLSTLLAYAISDQSKLPTIAQDLLGVEINYIINIIKNGKVDVADVVSTICGTHTIGNYIEDFVKLPNKALINAVQNVSLSELANLIFGGNFTTAKLAEFVKNTVNGNETVGSLVIDLIGMTVSGGVYYFKNGQRAFRVIQEVFGINIVEVIKDAQTYLKNYASYDFEDILQMIGELEGYEYDYEHNTFVKEPILAFVTVGVAGVALYFLANDVLVDLAGDMTYLELISKIAGREENGKYIFEIDDGVETDSPFYNKLITKNIGETLKKGYDFLGEFKDVLGIGNIAVPFTDEIVRFIFSLTTPRYTISYTTEESGEVTWKVEGYFGSVITAVYNLTYTGLEKAIKDKTVVEYVIKLFKDVSIRDVTVDILPEKIKENKLVDNIRDLTVGIIYYDLVKGSDRLEVIKQYILDGVSTSTLLDFVMTKEAQDKLPRLVRDLIAVEFNYIIDEVKTVIDTKKLYLLDIISNVVGETTTIKDYLDFVKLPNNEAVNKVTAVVIYEFAEALLGSDNKAEVILDYFGTFTFGDVLSGGLPKKIEDNQLTQNIYALSALIIYEDIVKADDKLAAFEEKVLDKVTLSTLLAYVMQDQSKLPTIAKDVLALEVNFIIETVKTAVKDQKVYVANILSKLFGERTIGEYVQDFVKIPANKAVVKITNIVIYDFVMDLLNGNDKVQVLLDYLGSWTVGDLLESGLPEAIENNQLTQNVYALSANIIYNDIVKANDILAAVEEKVLDKVALSTLLAYAMQDQSKLPTIAKDLLALEVNYIIDTVKSIIKDKVVYVANIVGKVFGERTIGEYVQDFVTIPGNKAIVKITNVVIYDFVMDLLNSNDKVQTLLDYFGSWTVGDLLESGLPADVEENQLTQNVYKLSAIIIYNEIVKANDILAAIEEKVFDNVTLSNLLAYAVKDQSKLPNIAKDLLALEVNYIIDTVKQIIKDKVVYVANIVSKVCGERTIGDYLDFLTLPDNAAVEKVTSVVIYDLVMDLLNSNDKAQVLLDYFGTIRVGEVIAEATGYVEDEDFGVWIRKDDRNLKAYTLLEIAYDLALNDVLGFLLDGKFKANDVANFVQKIVQGNETVGSLLMDLIGITYADGKYYFSNGQRAYRIIAETFGINVVELIKDAQTYLKNYASYDLDDIIQMIGELEGYTYDYKAEKFTTTPVLAYVTVAAIGAVMYFVANDVLVDLAGDMTYFDALKDPLKVSESEGKYVFADTNVDTPLYNKLMPKKIGETLKKGYDFLGEFKSVLGVGNLAAVFTNKLGKYTVTYLTTYSEEGTITWKVEGNYGSVISGLYNVTYTGLEKAIKDKKVGDYVLDLFGDVSVGDLTVQIIPEKIKNNQLVTNVNAITVNTVYNKFVKGNDILAAVQENVLDKVSTSTLLEFVMTKEAQDKLPRLVRDLAAVEFNYVIDEVKTVIDTKKLYLLDIISEVIGEETTIRDYLDFVKLPNNDVVNKVTAVVIYDFAEAMINSANKEEVILDYFGTWTIGDVLYNTLPEKVENNQLTQNVYALSALTIYKDIVKADDKLAAIEDKLLADVALSTLLAYAMEDQSKLPTIAKDLLAIQVNYIIDTVKTIVKDKVVYIANIVDNVFGDRTIGDYVKDFVKLPNNKAINSITSVVISDFVKELFSSDNKVQTLLDYFGSWTVGDLLGGAFNKTIEENQFTQNVYALSANVVYNDIVKASNVLTAIEEKVFTKVTLSTLLAYAMQDQSKLPAIAKDVLALEVNYIIDTVEESSKTGIVYVADIVKEICGDRTISDYVKDFAKLPDNTALNSVTSIVISTLVADLFNSDDKAQVLVDAFADWRIGDAIGGLVGYAEDTNFGIWVTKKNSNVKANTLVEVALDISVKKVLEFLLDKKFDTNSIANFAQETLQGNETVGSLAYDLLSMTYTEGVYYFSNGQRAYRIIAEVFGLNLVEIIKNAQTYLKNYASYELDDIVQMIGELEGYTYDYKANKFTKTPVLAYVTLGAIGAAMYFVANDVLVDVVGDTTYFDALKDALNVSENNGKYVFAGTNVDTPLYNKLMPKKIGETLKKGYDFKGEFKDLLGVGNLAAVFTDKLGKYTVTYTTAESGETTWNVVGNYGSVISGLYNVTYNGLEKAIKDKKVVDYVIDLFGDVSVGDLTVQIIPEKIKTNKLVENVNAITVSIVYNEFVKGNDKLAAVQENVLKDVSFSTLAEFGITKAKQDKLPRLVRDLLAVEINYVIDEVKTVKDTNKLYLLDIISEVVGEETTVRDYLDFVKLPNNDVVNKTTAVVIYDFAEAMFNGDDKLEVVFEYFGTWTVGDALYNTLPKKVENNQLTQNVFAVSPNGVYKDIVKADDKLAAVEDVLFTDVTLSTLLAYAMEDQSKLPTIVKDVLAVEVNYIIDTTKQIVKDKVVYVANIANKLFGERTVGDYVKDFVKLPNNKAINNVTSVVVYDFVMAFAANKDKVQVLLDYFGTWTIGDLLEGSFNKTIEENQLTQNVYALSAKVVYNDIVKANDVLAAVEEKVLTNVTLSTLLAYAVKDQSKLPTIAKDVLAIEVNYIIDTAKQIAKDKVVYVSNIVSKVFGERTVGDYVKDFVKLPNNNAIIKITNVVVYDFVMAMAANKDRVQVVLDYFGTWTIGDLLEGAFSKTVEENQLTQNVYALSAKVIYNDIVKAKDKLTAVKENVFTSVTLSNLLAYAVKDQSKLPNIVKDILAVEVNYVIDEVKSIKDTKKLYLLDIITEVTGKTKTVKEYLDFVKLPDNAAVNKATSVVIYDFVDAMLASNDKKQVVLDYFGTWTVGDALGDKLGYVENEELSIWVTKKDANVKANTLTETLLDMQIKTPLSFLLKGKFTANDFATLAKEIVNDNETIGSLVYNMFEMKYVDNVYYFKNGQRAYRIVTEVFGLNVIELIKNAKAYITDYTKYSFDDLVQMIGELEGYKYDYAADKFTKTPVLAYATLGAIGVGMYYGANNLLVKVCGSITYYSALKDVLKITRDGDDYLLGTDKLATPLFNKVLPLKLSETLKKGYDLKGLVKDVLTIGNLTAMYTSKLKLGGVAALNAEQKWTVSGKYGNVIAAIYNVNVFEAKDAIRKRNGMTLKSYLLDTFDGIIAGDLLAPTLKAELKENVWYKGEKKYLRLYNDLLNTNVVAVIRFISDSAKSDSLNLRQLLYLMFTDDATVEYYFGQILKYSVNENGELVNKNGEYANVVLENIFQENFINFIVTTVKNVSKPKTLITDILGNAKIGDIILTGYRLNANDEWAKVDGTVYAFNSSLAAIEKVVYAIEIADLINGFDVESIFGDMYIGELLGYNKNGEEWTDKNGAALTGFNLTLAKLKITDLVDASNPLDLFNGLYIGDILGYTYDKANDKWYSDADKTTELTGFNLKLAGITIEDLTTTTDPLKLFEDMYIGELLGYTKNGDEWYNGEEKLTGFNLKLAGITIARLTGTKNPLELFNDMYIGELLGYTKNGDEWYNGEEKLTGFNLRLAGITIEQLTQTKNPLELFNKMYIGEILGYTHDETNDVWYDKDGTTLTGFNLKLAKITIEQLTTTDDPIELFGDVYVGEILGYTKEGTVWMRGETPITSGFELVLADITIGELIKAQNDPLSLFGEVYIGDIIGYTPANEAKTEWKDQNGNAVKGFNLAIAKLKIGQINGTNDMLSLFGDLQIGEMFGYTYDATSGKWKDKGGNDVNALVNAIASIKISDTTAEGFDLMTTIKDVKLGDVMGYTYENGKWTKDGAVAESLIQIIAKYTIGDIQDGNFSSTLMGDIKSTVTVKDIFGGSTTPTTGIFALLSDADWNAPIGALETIMSNKMSNLVVADLAKLGVVSDINKVINSRVAINGVDSLLKTDATYSNYKWTDATYDSTTGLITACSAKLIEKDATTGEGTYWTEIVKLSDFFDVVFSASL